MTNELQATIQKQLIPAVEAYVELVTNPNYFNEVLGINLSKLPISIGAHTVGPGTFSIEHNTDIFTTEPELNAQRVSNFISNEFLIYFAVPENLDAHSDFAGITFNSQEFGSDYDHKMVGFPQFLYDFLFHLIEKNIYCVESALAIFGSLLHQITVPFWGEFTDKEELQDTETYRLLGVHFEIVAAIQHDLGHSKKQYASAS